MNVPAFIVDWARLPGPSKLLATARTKLEAGRLGPRAKLDLEFTPSERSEVGRMLDAAWAGSGEPVPIARLRHSLAEHGTTLEALLTQVSGPLRDLRSERAQQVTTRQTDRDEGLATLGALGAGAVDPAVLQRCLVGAAFWSVRAADITRVVQHLDGLARTRSQPVHLAVLAASLFGDAHALDRDAGLGRAVARFLRGRATTEDEPYTDPVGDATAWHAAWESGGVICDGVSARALVLNLPLTGDGSAARLAEIRGEPVWLTLRALRQPFRLADGIEEVFVCENPAIVEAAADRFGAASRPLVCTFGNPDLATTTLLQGIAPQTRLRIRADGDRVGWQIVERLLRLPGAQPWRMPRGFERYEEEIIEDLLGDLAL
ncbi:DUF2399 domain-containing protein [Aestuariimicrobium sp. Y1814]|uniref:DUF2399 domain-containing protein n=1 Tax=Aestuariimicrobium sp. Y1814 TaxID=3418742 RepID=UPI003DA79B92